MFPSGTSSVLPETRTPRSRDPAPTLASRTRLPREADRSRLAKDILKQLAPVPQPLASPWSNLPQDFLESAPDKEERPAVTGLLLSESPPSKRSGPTPGAEIISISSDEEQDTIDLTTNTIEPIDVDAEVGTEAQFPKVHPNCL